MYYYMERVHIITCILKKMEIQKPVDSTARVPLEEKKKLSNSLLYCFVNWSVIYFANWFHNVYSVFKPYCMQCQNLTYRDVQYISMDLPAKLTYSWKSILVEHYQNT